MCMTGSKTGKELVEIPSQFWFAGQGGHILVGEMLGLGGLGPAAPSKPLLWATVLHNFQIRPPEYHAWI